MKLIKKLFHIINKYFVPVLEILTIIFLAYFTFSTLKKINKPMVIEDKKADETSAGPVLKITPNMIISKIGESFDINLILETNNLSVSAVDFAITYDPTVLRVNYVNPTTFLPVVLKAPVNNPGTVSMTLGSDPNLPKIGTDSLALINFTVINFGNVSINYTSNSRVDVVNQQDNVSTSLISANILVPTPTSSSPPGSIVKIYAAGGNGKKSPDMDLVIDNKDVLTIKKVSGNMVNREFEVYTYNSPTKLSNDQIKIKLVTPSQKNNADKILVVDKINIDGVDYQTEDDSVYTEYDKKEGCQSGYRKSEDLYCAGSFQY